MRILLVGLGSRYNHVNLAVRTIASYVNEYLEPDEKQRCSVLYAEWTVAVPILELLRNIVRYKPDVVLFSVYIWNGTVALELASELPKIIANVIIGAGGPEVSYCAQNLLTAHSCIDFIMAGEGENTVLDVCRALIQCEPPLSSADECAPRQHTRNRFLKTLVQNPISGVWYRNGTVPAFAGERSVISDMGSIPFPYRGADGTFARDVDPEHDIIYYESSRGCPFRCSYCLSSIDKSVRFAPLERVFADIQFFMDNGCRLVKFTDRTFNLNERRYSAIWQYIIEHHNGKTVFHFEIAAQQLSAAALNLLQRVPSGAMQFEIGIQSIHPATLAQAGRACNPAQLAEIVRQIPERIHVHLDLIAGLPHENFEQFGKSFDYTAALAPDMIQLGFLKILSGTAMETFALHNPAYKWLSAAPYEVLSSSDMTYEDLLQLKRIERLTDLYYNSGSYSYTMKYVLSRNVSLFTFFNEFAVYFESRGLFDELHKSAALFEFLHDFYGTAAASFALLDRSVLEDLLRFDFIRREKPGRFPSWYCRRYSKDIHNEAVRRCTMVKNTRETFSLTEYDEFTVHPETYVQVSGGCRILFIYPSRSGDSEIRLKTEATSVKAQRVSWLQIDD